MQMTKHILPLFAVGLIFTGCASSKITNLTPTKVERNANNTYTIEAAWQTREHAFRPQSLKPQVLVGSQTYPMRQVPVVRDRFEATVPVAPSENVLRYRFKFDYEYNAIPVPRRNSKLSPEYKLEIVDKK